MTGAAKLGVQLPGLGRLAEVLSPSAFDKTIARAATRAVVMLQKVTPQRFNHQMIKSWTVEQGWAGQRIIKNNYRTTHNGQSYWVADLVEYGTMNEGTGYIEPKPPKKRLFIPLTAKAARAYAMGTKTRKGLKYGVDYVLALRAHGIKPKYFVRDVTPAINDMVKDLLVQYLKSELASKGGRA